MRSCLQNDKGLFLLLLLTEHILKRFDRKILKHRVYNTPSQRKRIFRWTSSSRECKRSKNSHDQALINLCFPNWNSNRLSLHTKARKASGANNNWHSQSRVGRYRQTKESIDAAAIDVRASSSWGRPLHYRPDVTALDQRRGAARQAERRFDTKLPHSRGACRFSLVNRIIDCNALRNWGCNVSLHLHSFTAFSGRGAPFVVALSCPSNTPALRASRPLHFFSRMQHPLRHCASGRGSARARAGFSSFPR